MVLPYYRDTLQIKVNGKEQGMDNRAKSKLKCKTGQNVFTHIFICEHVQGGCEENCSHCHSEVPIKSH